MRRPDLNGFSEVRRCCAWPASNAFAFEFLYRRTPQPPSWKAGDSVASPQGTRVHGFLHEVDIDVAITACVEECQSLRTS